MIVVDTDILTLIHRGEGQLYQNLTRRLPTNGVEPLHTTVISLEEQLRGWLAYIAKAKSDERQIVGYARLRAICERVSARPLLDYDERAARKYRELVAQKIRIGTMDLKIAAIVLVHDATLITRNLADFRKVSGLRAEDWTA